MTTEAKLGAIFANYLRKWTTDAGSRHPKEFDLNH